MEGDSRRAGIDVYHDWHELSKLERHHLTDVEGTTPHKVLSKSTINSAGVVFQLTCASILSMSSKKGYPNKVEQQKLPQPLAVQMVDV
ncbi:conserved hypothetical protein [Culex quinquefasciatus]|uniref:Uncharacterized protein n=1 Tax=Culex quinquefasciatus TaxID=7176 RepID=B0X4T8_CULQU|nr:conserved hypothetical protein [Culex quinquefasciatus]|eukprot:XP_001864660.1 conserved hypothetical protein [Culex quinquefasciatus]